jgi:hypothetical protein
LIGICGTLCKVLEIIPTEKKAMATSTSKPSNERDGLMNVIRLTRAEVASNLDRQKWAEGLILQLPASHDGRNSWLMNYGAGEAAETLRAARGLKLNSESRAVNPPMDDTEPRTAAGSLD